MMFRGPALAALLLSLGGCATAPAPSHADQPKLAIEQSGTVSHDFQVKAEQAVRTPKVVRRAAGIQSAQGGAS
jgi:hypothetical protein